MSRKPLSDLCIKDFIIPSSTSTSKKRPLNSNLLSPSKRRVLDSEGIPYLSPNPRSILSTIYKADIPARKLDFGSSKSVGCPNTSLIVSKKTPPVLAQPCPITTAVITTTSKFTTTTTTIATKTSIPNRPIASTSSSTTSTLEMDNPFATPRSPKSESTLSLDVTPQPGKRFHTNSEWRYTRDNTVFEDIRIRNASLLSPLRDQEITSADYYYVDRQSDHYPGFDIYYDPTRKQVPKALSGVGKEDESGTKENTQPSWKSKKAASLPNPNTLIGNQEEMTRSRSIPVAKC